MVTPTNGNVLFRGKSGKTYPINVYISDVAAALCPFSLYGLAAAGGDSSYILEEDCRIEDISITTGPTVITTINLQLGNRPGYGVFAIKQYLDTLNNRPQNPTGWIRGGSKVQFVQA